MDYLLKLKQDHEKLVPGIKVNVDKLDPYLYLRKKKKEDIIKAASTIETSSRYILEGFIGLYQEDETGEKLCEVFQASDVAFDFRSYLTQKMSSYYLKCISDVVYFELSKKYELEIISRFPHLAELGLAVNHRLLKRIVHRNNIRGLGISKGYKEFFNYMPGLEPHLTQPIIASYFSCSERTVRLVQQNFKSGLL